MRTSVFSAALAVAAAALPEQINLHYAGAAGDGSLSVDYVSTTDKTGGVKWGLSPSALTNVYPSTTSFAYDTIGFLHQGFLNTSTVAPGAPVYYSVGSDAGGWSPVFTVTPKVTRPEVHCVFGDFGIANDVCMADLVKDAQAGVYDSVLHVGDWAYNFEQGTPASSVGNSFMNAIQGYASIKPVVVAAGNHEACPTCTASASLPQSAGNFTQYRARMHSVSLFSNTGNNIFYSINQGLTHFIIFSAEAYLYARSPDFIANQLAFMKADLAAVDRKATPWVVALVHKDWTMEAEAFADFYPIIEAGGVDVLFCGHVHYYSRFAPYNAPSGQIDSASVSGPINNQVYTNPKYLVNIITGASGDREKDSKCPKGTPVPPELTCTQNYGYGFFTAVNATTATWTFKTVEQDGPSGPYSDALTIVQNNHGPRA